MGVTRVVPDLAVRDVRASLDLYAGLFDLDVAMDLGWVGNLGPRDDAAVQLQFARGAESTSLARVGTGGRQDPVMTR